MVFGLESKGGSALAAFIAESLHVLGVNHQTASLAVREQMMFSPSLLKRAYDDIRQTCAVDEVVLYSTCSRTECVVVTHDIAAVQAWFANFHGVALSQLMDHHYHHQGKAAVQHLMAVAAGINSYIVGETQILGQLKKAFATSSASYALGPVLHRLFPMVFSAAKKIRTETAIGTSSISLAAAIVGLAKGLFCNIEDCRVMMIGAGEMMTLTATHLHAHGVRSWRMVNRTLEKAQYLAETFAGQAAVISELPRYLSQVDVIISATASPVPLLGKGLLERTMLQRNHKPLLLADLAMPRDIEPEVASLEHVHLYHIDALHQMIEINQQKRASAIVAAQPIIDTYTQQFFAEQRARQSVKTIRQFRKQIDRLRDQALAEALQSIGHGQVTEQVLRQCFVHLTNQIMHTPTVRLRQAAAEHDYKVLQAAGYLLDFEAPQEQEAQG